MLKVAIWKSNSGCRARERMKTHTEFSMHMLHTNNYVHIHGWVTQQLCGHTCPDNKSLSHQMQRFGLARFWTISVYGTSLRRCPRPHLLWVMTFDTKTLGDPKHHWIPAHVEIWVALTACMMVHAVNKYLRCFRFTAMTWCSGLGGFCVAVLLRSCLYVVCYVGEMDVNGDSHTLTRWGCYRPGSCSSCLKNVSWIIERCFPEKVREKETKHSSAQDRRGRVP